MDKPDYSNKQALVEYYSKKYPDDYDFVQYLSERLDYFSDRFSEEHEEYFDMLWKECIKRLQLRRNNG